MSTAGDESQYEDSPAGWAKRYDQELTSAEKSLEKWHEDARKVNARYLDDRTGEGYDDVAKVNYFPANIQTQEAMLFGKTPTVDVAREFADAKDDIARVGGEMLERTLICEMKKDGYARALQYALSDSLKFDFGSARVRYSAETEATEAVAAKMSEDGEVLAEAIPAGEKLKSETVFFDYLHWSDHLWTPARIWEEVRINFFRTHLSRSQCVRRFGSKIGNSLPMNAGKKKADDNDARRDDPWGRAEVWEIWDKEAQKVRWYCRGFPAILDEKKDEYGLDGFFPCPRPLLQNASTSAFIPRPDYHFCKDLYVELDVLAARLRLLADAVRVAGLYNGAEKGLDGLLDDKGFNKLYPVDNWALFAERGGIRGAIDWLPLEQIVAALASLTERQQAVKATLYEVSGWSDIMRGQGEGPGVTLGEQKLKAQYASVRMQRRQDEFARFATDLQKMKKQLICDKYEPQRIIELSNIQYTPDAQLAPQAVEFLKTRAADYRVEVKSDALSQTDYALMQSERTQAVKGLNDFIVAFTPFAQAFGPTAMKLGFDLLEWYFAGLRGSAQAEGIIDRARADWEAQQQQAAQQPQQQNPDVVKEQAKASTLQLKHGLDMQKEQAKLQNELVKAQIDVQSERATQQIQTEENVKQTVMQARVRARERAMNPEPTNGAKK